MDHLKDGGIVEVHHRCIFNSHRYNVAYLVVQQPMVASTHVPKT